MPLFITQGHKKIQPIINHLGIAYADSRLALLKDPALPSQAPSIQ